MEKALSYDLLEIDRAVRSLKLDKIRKANAAMPLTVAAIVRRLATLWAGIRPLAVAAMRIPLLPKAWQEAIAVYVDVADALGAAIPVDPDFKAGKDL